MSTTRLPELPEAQWWYTDDSQAAMNMSFGLPEEKPLFTADQMHAYGLAVWKAAMEAAAKAVNAKFLQPMTKQHAEAVHNIAIRECLDAIRSLPLPEQGGPQERRE